LKHDPATRHIPVHIISGDENRRRGLALGAMTYLEKSAANDSLAEAFTRIEHSTQHRRKKLLVVCADPDERAAMVNMLHASDVEIFDAATGGEALAVARQQYLAGIIVHLELTDIAPLPLVEELQRQILSELNAPPTILFTNRPLTTDEEMDLVRLSRTSIVKPVTSYERLLDESVLLLHRDEANLRSDQRSVLENLRLTDPALAGKTVLVVDDDVRNIFALTSLLEDHHLNVLHAENGRAGIELLRSTPKVDLVLMDIMMPEMDGYETMKAIRQEPQFRSLPIIALTAKAMKGDRGKCIEAGAVDYITKPVDLEQLFSVLRVWINRDNDMVQLSASKM
jgi:CheY-like chemotaxis protein